MEISALKDLPEAEHVHREADVIAKNVELIEAEFPESFSPKTQIRESELTHWDEELPEGSIKNFALIFFQ